MCYIALSVTEYVLNTKYTNDVRIHLGQLQLYTRANYNYAIDINKSYVI